jgi:hypothetical protein
VSGGTSGFNAVLGGNRSNGQYARLEAHGVYWTASDNDPGTAPYYNFGKNGQALHRQPQGEKRMAISVRCVRSDRSKLWPAGHFEMEGRAGEPSRWNTLRGAPRAALGECVLKRQTS